MFGEQRTAERLIVDFGAMEVTSAGEDNTTETLAIAIEKVWVISHLFMMIQLNST